VFVCVCCAVTMDVVRAAIAAGASTVEEVSAMTGACLGCGTCWERIEDLFEGVG
jgi:bacterioferritin-associated ferredoxin